MSAAAPWSVKGIEPKAREIAKDLARRSGMTLGEWLNTMILEDDEDGVVPLSRRPHAADSFERRGRSRRVDDEYGQGEQPWNRLEASIDAIAARLEASERRSTIAIQGVDQAVSGLVRRLESQDQAGQAHGRRIDDIAEELREGHKRLRKFEQDVGPRTAETFGKVETTLGALAGRLYDMEERQRGSVNELRQRMDTVEKSGGAGGDVLAQVGRRLDEAQARTTEALRGLERSFAGLDQRLRVAETRVEPESSREAARFEKLAETLTRSVEANRAEMMRRLDTAESEGRMDRIERAVMSIGEQLQASEARSARAVEAMGREVLNIAQNLNGRVQKVETETPVRIERLAREIDATVGGKVEAGIARVAQGLERSLDQRLTAADDRHALALEKLGGEITRISDRLSERIAQSERRSAQALDDIGRRLMESSGRIEQQYDRASGELAERMRLSEERTAALIAEARESFERRTEIAPAAVPAPVQEPLPVARAEAVADWRAAAFPDAVFPEESFSATPFAEVRAPIGSAMADPFLDDPAFAEQQAWSAQLAPPEPEPEVAKPFGAPGERELTADAIFDAVMRGPAVPPDATPFGTASAVETPVVPAWSVQAQPVAPEPVAMSAFGRGFGGADVSDALAATDPSGHHDDPDDFSGDTEFVDQRALRSAAAQGRASSTRQAIDAARAAMAAPATEAPARSGFGLKRGGKSKLQERLDKQAKGGDTVRKALGASGVAVALTLGGAYAFSEVTGAGIDLPFVSQAEAQPVAALAITDATPVDAARAEELYQTAVVLLESDDPAGAARLTEAAQAGSTKAQVQLAELYQSGEKGVTADPVQARDWLRQAAASEDAKAMHNYATALYDGEGGPRDTGEALIWFRKAAEKGLIDSQFNVARLYEVGGDGIAPDPVAAYTWYLIASRAGDSDAQAAVERLRIALPAAERGKARAQADRFQVQPLS